MTYLSGSQILSHLSRFISDKSPPKIESFVAKIVATNIPRAMQAAGSEAERRQAGRTDVKVRVALLT